MDMVNRLRVLGRDVRGLSTVEYTILLVLVVAGTVGLWNNFGKDLKGKLNKSTGDFAGVGK
jgi:Flp pilus assembly pilin Flp